MVKICQKGMGCVMVKANILRKHNKLKFYNKVVKGRKFLNEDLTFTDNLRKKGYDLWLDLKMQCLHDMKGRI